MRKQFKLWLYACDEPTCNVTALDDPVGWWVGKSHKFHYCPAHLTPPCLRCEKPMRRDRAKAADFPGTVAYNGHGLCQSCWQALHRADRVSPVDNVPKHTLDSVRNLVKGVAGEDIILAALGIKKEDA